MAVAAAALAQVGMRVIVRGGSDSVHGRSRGKRKQETSCPDRVSRPLVWSAVCHREDSS